MECLGRFALWESEVNIRQHTYAEPCLDLSHLVLLIITARTAPIAARTTESISAGCREIRLALAKPLGRVHPPPHRLEIARNLVLGSHRWVSIRVAREGRVELVPFLDGFGAFGDGRAGTFQGVFDSVGVFFEGERDGHFGLVAHARQGATYTTFGFGGVGRWARCAVQREEAGEVGEVVDELGPLVGQVLLVDLGKVVECRDHEVLMSERSEPSRVSKGF